MTSPDHDLRRALVGSRHRELYERNTAFARSVNNLAALLPAMVDGLAAHAAALEPGDEEAVSLLDPPGPVQQGASPSR